MLHTANLFGILPPGSLRLIFKSLSNQIGFDASDQDRPADQYDAV